MDRYVVIKLGDKKDSPSISLNVLTTSPVRGGLCYIQAVRTPGDLVYNLEVSLGEIRRVSENITKPSDEILYYKKNASADVSQKPFAGLETDWLGYDRGKVIYQEEKILNIEQDSVGVLRAGYRYLVDVWELSNVWETGIPILICAIVDGKSIADTTVTFIPRDIVEDALPECENIMLEKVSPQNVFRGDTVEFFATGIRPDGKKSTAGQPIAEIETRYVQEKEEVTAKEGLATVKYMIANIISITADVETGGYSFIGNEITIPKFFEDQYVSIPILVIYNTEKTFYQTDIPSGYPSNETIITFEFNNCAPKELSFPVTDPEGPVDVTLRLVNDDTGEALPDALLQITPQGGGPIVNINTNSQGEILLTDQRPGDKYDLIWTKPGFIPSYDDDLDNDELTIPSE